MKEYDRVRCSTSKKINKQIENKILENIKQFVGKTDSEITERLIEIEKEWSIERWLELNASLLAFIGVLLAAFFSPYWLFLPGLVLPFLALHAVQGWCPPVPIMRRLNIRTRREIDWEKFSLKFVRGDFGDLLLNKQVDELFEKIKKIA